MVITQEVFRGALFCPYKAYLLLRGEKGVKSEYETFFAGIAEKYCAEALRRFNVIENTFENICDQNKEQEGVLYRTYIAGNGTNANCVIERVKGGSALGAVHYAPVMVSTNGKISKEDRMTLAYEGLVLESVQSETTRILPSNL